LSASASLFPSLSQRRSFRNTPILSLIPPSLNSSLKLFRLSPQCTVRWRDVYNGEPCPYAIYLHSWCLTASAYIYKTQRRPFFFWWGEYSIQSCSQKTWQSCLEASQGWPYLKTRERG
jgi:hypothetical protein